MRVAAMKRAFTPHGLLAQRHFAPSRGLCACASDDNNDKWKTRHPSTPATPSDGATTTASKLVKEKVWQNVQGNKTIFPWRHETEPLERLIDPNVYGGVHGPGMRPFPWIIKVLMTQAAAVHLNVPWYQVFTTSGWKEELADASGYAFSQAVAGVLSNTFKVPFQNVVSDDGTVDFDTITEVGEKEDDTTSERAESSDETDNSENDKGEDSETVEPEVEYMMEEKLRKLYEASHEFGKDQMRIVLQTEPVHCELVSLLFVPYITRQAVHDAPSLRHSLRNLFQEIEKKQIDENGQRTSLVKMVNYGFQIFADYVNSRASYDREDDTIVLESTVIAQVSIECDEIFAVTDVATGMLLQGNGEKQRVSHLVRLEVTVKERVAKSSGKSVFEVGSWQIVDWDDLEDGNIWYI